MKELKITISGRNNTGKTTVARVIQDALEAHGIHVLVRDEGCPIKLGRTGHQMCVEALKGDLIARIETVQINPDLR